MNPADLPMAAYQWIAGDPDERTRQQLQELLDNGEVAALADHVGASLTFGTAGLRGAVGPGPNRMNRAVVIRTTRGFADHLLTTNPDAAERGVVVGFDARHDSERFARDVVEVFAGAGIKVSWFPSPQPTPLVAYAQKALDAVAAVVVTASHNPPQDNGYKVYGDGAAQIAPPVDEAIAAAIAEVGPANEVPRVELLDSELVAPVGGEVLDRYFAELIAARPPVEGPPLTLAYTPLHGVAGPHVRRALAEAGYDDLHVVASQEAPDGDFPTVSFPNPEEPGAMDALLALAEDVGADLAIANDPDGDRLAVALPGADGHLHPLTGNQIGVLLADHLLRGVDVDRPLVVSSIVSTPMVHAVAATYDARSEVTLTGFKWIWAAARDLERADQRTVVFGFEEALGSSVGNVVRDKDGIGAAVAFADLVRSLKAQGETVADRWAALCREHGLWVSHQLALTRPGASGADEIAAAMGSLAGAEGVPETLAGHRVTASTDYRTGAEQRPPWLAVHDLVAMELEDGRAMIRPSGTEPKCKIYIDLRAEVAGDTDIDARTAELRAEAAEVAQALAAHVGLR